MFHPDYTYSDFVGQILPNVTEGNVSYEFIPGPFTRLLKKAHDNPSEEYCLIVEEINRGNAPAIFGEVFQLLDRDNEIISESSVVASIGVVNEADRAAALSDVRYTHEEVFSRLKESLNE